MCSCSQALSSPSVLTITRSPLSIRIQQSEGGTYTHSDFQSILRAIVFEYDPSQPDSSVEIYSAQVNVVAHDGVLASPVSSTDIHVAVVNLAPVVILNGEVRYKWTL